MPTLGAVRIEDVAYAARQVLAALRCRFYAAPGVKKLWRCALLRALEGNVDGADFSVDARGGVDKSFRMDAHVHNAGR